jgi:hypothetical protein
LAQGTHTTPYDCSTKVIDWGGPKIIWSQTCKVS